jgi:DNA-binding transcriptional MerR regulator
MAAGAGPKSPGAFRTIGEVSAQTGIPQHVLRYWETRFPQLKPVTRAGSRRYYRPDDVALIERIDRLLNREGYTVKGAQAVIAAGDAPAGTVQAVRDLLARALAEDR